MDLLNMLLAVLPGIVSLIHAREGCTGNFYVRLTSNYEVYRKTVWWPSGALLVEEEGCWSSGGDNRTSVRIVNELNQTVAKGRDEAFLIMTEITPAFSGRYWCEVRRRSIDGRQPDTLCKRIFHLSINVIVPPTITALGVRDADLERPSVTHTCCARGFPRPRIRWHVNGTACSDCNVSSWTVSPQVERGITSACSNLTIPVDIGTVANPGGSGIYVECSARLEFSDTCSPIHDVREKSQAVVRKCQAMVRSIASVGKVMNVTVSGKPETHEGRSWTLTSPSSSGAEQNATSDEMAMPSIGWKMLPLPFTRQREVSTQYVEQTTSLPKSKPSSCTSAGGVVSPTTASGADTTMTVLVGFAAGFFGLLIGILIGRACRQPALRSAQLQLSSTSLSTDTSHL